MTQGKGIMSHVFDGYAPWAGDLKTRQNGSLVATEAGSAFAYSIWKLQERGSFFITPATDVYVGMVVGENSRENDLNVNVCKNKKLTNVRSAGADDALNLTPGAQDDPRRRPRIHRRRRAGGDHADFHPAAQEGSRAGMRK
jgi:GTP-binding protein